MCTSSQVNSRQRSGTIYSQVLKKQWARWSPGSWLKGNQVVLTVTLISFTLWSILVFFPQVWISTSMLSDSHFFTHFPLEWMLLRAGPIQGLSFPLCPKHLSRCLTVNRCTMMCSRLMFLWICFISLQLESLALGKTWHFNFSLFYWVGPCWNEHLWITYLAITKDGKCDVVSVLWKIPNNRMEDKKTKRNKRCHLKVIYIKKKPNEFKRTILNLYDMEYLIGFQNEVGYSKTHTG